MSIEKIEAIKSVVSKLKFKDPKPEWIVVEQLDPDELVIECPSMAFSWKQAQTIIDMVKANVGLDCIKERADCVGQGYLVSAKIPYDDAFVKAKHDNVVKEFVGLVKACRDI